MVKRNSILRDVQIARQTAAGGHEAWMSFQRRRTGNNSGSVTTPMTWPASRRPPAGISSLEFDSKQRLVATAQPSVRAKQSSRPRHLHPLEHSKETTKVRGSRHISEKQQPQDSHSKPWAQRWANLRSEQTNVLFKGMSEKDVKEMEESQNGQARKNEHDRWLHKPRKKRDTILNLSEKEAAFVKQLRGVYANSTEKASRAQRIRDSLKALQDRNLHTEIHQSIRDYQKKVEVDKNTRIELKRVRERFRKDKQRRTIFSHISLQALDSPQVARHAYGLPEDGKEFEETKIASKTEKKLQEIWQKAVKRTVAVDRLINIKPKQDVTFPIIRIKRNSSKLHTVTTPDDGQRRPSDNSMADVQVAMGELEALSSVGSDLEDNLTDIGEEDDEM